MFALIDVNGMYASCEQAFRPDLANRAVAVLSNNDGNIVARNYLAKKAGLKMGDPYFKVRPIIERHNIAIFSSNYTLYASMSARFAAVNIDRGNWQFGRVERTVDDGRDV